MIHLARPIVTPVANIVFCCFVFLDLASGDGHISMYGQQPPWLWVGRVVQFATFYGSIQAKTFVTLFPICWDDRLDY